MVSITRTLTMEEYAAANDLSLRKGTKKQRINHLLYIRLGPYIALVLLLASGLVAYGEHRRLGNEYYWPGFLWVMIVVLTVGSQRWFLRWKLKKLYAAQRMDRPWTVEADDNGVRSVLAGLSDSRLEWGYFTTFAENDALCVLVNSKRPSFLSFPKRAMTADEIVELRLLAERHLPK